MSFMKTKEEKVLRIIQINVIRTILFSLFCEANLYPLGWSERKVEVPVSLRTN